MADGVVTHKPGDLELAKREEVLVSVENKEDRRSQGGEYTSRRVACREIKQHLRYTCRVF